MKQFFPSQTPNSLGLLELQKHNDKQKDKDQRVMFIDPSFPPLSKSLFEGHEQMDDAVNTVKSNDPLILSSGMCYMIIYVYISYVTNQLNSTNPIKIIVLSYYIYIICYQSANQLNSMNSIKIILYTVVLC